MYASYKTTINSRKEIADGTFELNLKIPDDFSFIPGQYVWIMSANEWKAFSISSSRNQKGSITIIFRASKSLFKQNLINAPVGTAINVLGPFGFLRLPEEKLDRPVIFIAGGVGIAPFLSILRSLKKNSYQQKILLFYANSNPKKAVRLKELENFKKTLSDFSLHTIFGKLNIEFIKNNTKNLVKPYWYILGPKEMVEDIGSALLKTEEPSSVNFEEFYPTETEKELVSLMDSGITDIFKLAVESSFNHIVITDINGKIKYANQSSQLITGYTFEEMKNQTPRLWGGLMDKDFYKKLWTTIKTEHKPFHNEIRNRRKNGEEYTAIITISPINSTKNIPIGFIGTEEDISNLKKTEEELASKAAELRKEKAISDTARAKNETILKYLPIGVVMVDALSGEIADINPAGINILGRGIIYQARKKTFSATYDLLTESGKPYPEKDLPINIVLREKKEAVKDDIIIRKPDGKKINVHTIGIPVEDSHGNLIYAIAMFEDTTEHREIDREKNEFISLASHQLRTPVSAIRWYTESLLSGDLGEIKPSQKNYIKEAYEASRKMNELIGALLNVSRIELGTFNIKPRKINLKSTIRNVLEKLGQKINEKKIIIEENYGDTLPDISADPDLTEIIFQNLLSNAINYSYDNGRITIKIKRRENDLLISVQDRGIGIPKEQEEKIFTKLFRADNAREFHPDGTGLGLYIAKSIIDRAGGKIWFKHEKKGTIFYITMPPTGMKRKEG